MALPSSGPISACMINVEANLTSTTCAFLSGPTSTPATDSMVKLYDNATPTPVNQVAPHAYSEFYGKTFSSPTISVFTLDTTATNDWNNYSNNGGTNSSNEMSGDATVQSATKYVYYDINSNHAGIRVKIRKFGFGGGNFIIRLYDSFGNFVNAATALSTTTNFTSYTYLGSLGSRTKIDTNNQLVFLANEKNGAILQGEIEELYVVDPPFLQKESGDGTWTGDAYSETIGGVQKVAWFTQFNSMQGQTTKTTVHKIINDLNGNLQINARVIAVGDDTVARISVDQSTSSTGTWTSIISNYVGNVFYSTQNFDTSNGIYIRTTVETFGGDPVSNYDIQPSVKFS